MIRLNTPIEALILNLQSAGDIHYNITFTIVRNGTSKQETREGLLTTIGDNEVLLNDFSSGYFEVNYISVTNVNAADNFISVLKRTQLDQYNLTSQAIGIKFRESIEYTAASGWKVLDANGQFKTITESVSADADVQNSDGTYMTTVASGGTLVLPDSQINVNGVDEGDVVSVKAINVDLTDGVDPVVPTSVGLVGNTLTIEIPGGDDVDIEINGNPYDTIAAPNTVDIPVINSVPSAVGTISGSNVEIADSSAVIKDSAGTTLKTEAIPAEVSENITINDSTVNIRDTAFNLLHSVSVRAEATTTQDIADTTVENSDASYSVNVLAEQSLVLPDQQINVNSVDEGDIPSVGTIDIDITDGVNPVTPTSVTITGRTIDIVVPSGGGNYDLDLVDRFGNAFPTAIISANATWDLRTLTPFDFADIFLNELSAPSTIIQNAIIDLVDDLNSAGLWDEFHTIHPLVNGTANDHAVNLKYPFRNASSALGYYQGSPTHDSNGITTGINAGMIIPAPPYLYADPSNCFSVSCYSRTNNALASGNDAVDMGCADISYDEYMRLILRTNTDYQDAALGRNSSVYFNNSYTGRSDGLFTIVKNGSNGGISRNGTLLTGGSAFAFNTANTVRIGAIALGGIFLAGNIVMVGRPQRNYAYCASMKLFNMTQEADHYTAVQTFQTAMSRQV